MQQSPAAPSRRVSLAWCLVAVLVAVVALVAVGFASGVFRVRLFNPLIL